MGRASTLPGRERELAFVLDTLGTMSGAYLVGRAGVGKSRLVDAVAANAEKAGRAVVRVRATAGSSELPLGVFLTQLGASERQLTPMFAEIRERLLEQADGRPLLVCVDDVDLLDDASAVLVHQMVATGDAKLLATLRLGRLAPGEVVDLAQRGEIRRIDIEALDRAGTAAVAEDVLGRVIDQRSHDKLWAATHGNALFVRELLLGAAERDQIFDGPDGAVLGELPVSSPRLIDAVRSRLAQLDPELHRALVHLAFAEPCGPAELASVATDDQLATLETAEMVSTTVDQRRLVLRLGHPLYGEVLRSGTPLLQRRAVLAQLARDLQATGARRRADAVKLARLAVDGGVEADPSVLLRAAAIMFHTGDFVLAERVARRVHDTVPSFFSASRVANCLVDLGDEEGLQALLPEWENLAVTTGQRLAVRTLQLQFEFWIRGDGDRVGEVTQQALDELAADGIDPGSDRFVAEFDGTRCVLAMMSGDHRRALELADPLIARGADVAMLRGAGASSRALTTVGRPLDGIDRVTSAIDAFSVVGNEGSRQAERILLNVRAWCRIQAGDLDGARADSRQAMHEASDDLQRLIGLLTEATAEVLAGRPSTALDVLAQTATIPYQRTRSMSPRWLHVLTLFAAASAGDVDTADIAEHHYRSDTHPARLLDVYADIGAVRRLVAAGYPEDARDAARTAMTARGAAGDVVGEMFLAYELCRLDRAEEVVNRMNDLATDTQGELLPTMARHARSIVADDPDQLSDTAEHFASSGLHLYASEAAAHASEASRRAGDQRAASRSLNRAAELRLLCDGVVSQAPILDAGPVVLTRREREIAMLAAQGLASKEIGERLFISRRTAENHLAKVYDKLGVRTRAELSRLLDGGVAALAS